MIKDKEYGKHDWLNLTNGVFINETGTVSHKLLSYPSIVRYSPLGSRKPFMPSNFMKAWITLTYKRRMQCSILTKSGNSDLAFQIPIALMKYIVSLVDSIPDAQPISNPVYNKCASEIRMEEIRVTPYFEYLLEHGKNGILKDTKKIEEILSNNKYVIEEFVNKPLLDIGDL